MKRMDFKLENIPAVIATCVVLHNVCEMYGDNFSDEWATDSSSQSTQSSFSSRATTAGGNSTSTAIRDAIKDYLNKK